MKINNHNDRFCKYNMYFLFRLGFVNSRNTYLRLKNVGYWGDLNMY